MCKQWFYAALILAFVACPVFAQGPPPPPISPPEPTVTSSPDAAAIMALSEKIDSAMVRSDAGYVSSVLSSDFAKTYGDGWTTGHQPMAVDNKAAFLRKIADGGYLVHDLDPASVHFELHGDVAITYGRYVSLYEPKRGETANPSRLTSVWFERVYQKRDGKWIYLSDRTVHGPTISPAGVDPSAVTVVSLGLRGAGLWRESFVNLGPRRSVSSLASTSASSQGVQEPIDHSSDAEEVMALGNQLAAEVVKGDVDAVGSVLSDDFRMTHGDDWVRGGRPFLTDTRESFLTKRVAVKEYLARKLDSERVELHGNVAITYGQYVALLRHPIRPGQGWFEVWYERVWEKRDGKWMFLSHRTVSGPVYGPTRASVADQ